VHGYERDREHIIAGLESGLLDIAIMIGDASYPGLTTRPFWSERVMVAMPQDHKLASAERIAWPDLAIERFVLMARDPGPETRDLLLGRLGATGTQPHIRMDDVSRDTLLNMVAFGQRLSLVAESATGTDYPGVVFREIHEAGAHTRIGYSGYWRAESANLVLHQFLDFVAQRYALPRMA
jgi:DNA-binding transcriptional LysR family regulator